MPVMVFVIRFVPEMQSEKLNAFRHWESQTHFLIHFTDENCDTNLMKICPCIDF